MDMHASDPTHVHALDSMHMKNEICCWHLFRGVTCTCAQKCNCHLFEGIFHVVITTSLLDLNALVAAVLSLLFLWDLLVIW